MILPTLLICLAALAPDDCTEANAIAVVKGVRVATPFACLMELQAMLAETDLAAGAVAPKLTCPR
jgi:hypothetical protein